jgi:serine/alanine racemase
MRLAATVLVITCHTSPLAGVSVVGDLLTRIVARVAVPFYFMATGLFTLSQYHCDNRRLKGFMKKIGTIYAASVLLYLPLNIYQDYFNRPNLLPNLLRGLVFDGTVYHLWYLPAAMLGLTIVWRLVEKLDYPKGLAVAAVLYLVGLFGDSYYGIVGRLPVVKKFYDLLFQLFDYTRNGIFFAPIFMMLGGYMAEQKPRLTKWWNWAGFASGVVLMFTEGMLLHQYVIPRHDSMCLMLPICMVFLFRGLLRFRGREVRGTAHRRTGHLSCAPHGDSDGAGCGEDNTSGSAAGEEQSGLFCGGVRDIIFIWLCGGCAVVALCCKAKTPCRNRACLY